MLTSVMYTSQILEIILFENTSPLLNHNSPCFFTNWPSMDRKALPEILKDADGKYIED